MSLTELKVLSMDEIKKIHDASLVTLEETGLVVENEEVLKLLESNGCKVDYASQVAKIPRSKVKKALATCREIVFPIEFFACNGIIRKFPGEGSLHGAVGGMAVRAVF